MDIHATSSATCAQLDDRSKLPSGFGRVKGGDFYINRISGPIVDRSAMAAVSYASEAAGREFAVSFRSLCSEGDDTVLESLFGLAFYNLRSGSFSRFGDRTRDVSPSTMLDAIRLEHTTAASGGVTDSESGRAETALV